PRRGARGPAARASADDRGESDQRAGVRVRRGGERESHGIGLVGHRVTCSTRYQQCGQLRRLSSSGGSSSSGSSPSLDTNSYTVSDQQQLTPDQADYWKKLQQAVSDENLKTGIEGGNPMMRSYLGSYYRSLKSSPETKVNVGEGAAFRNPTYGRAAATDNGGRDRRRNRFA